MMVYIVAITGYIFSYKEPLSIIHHWKALTKCN